MMIRIWKKARAVTGPPDDFEDAAIQGYQVGKPTDPACILLTQVKTWLYEILGQP